MSAENLLILFTILIIIYIFSIFITTLPHLQKNEGDRRGATKKEVIHSNRLFLSADEISRLNAVRGYDNRCNTLAVKIINKIAPISLYEINFNYWTNEALEEYIEVSCKGLIDDGAKIYYHLTRKYVLSVINQVRIEQI